MPGNGAIDARAAGVKQLGSMDQWEHNLSSASCAECPDSMSQPSTRSWRDVAGDWRIWVWVAICLVVATVAWLLGYD